MLKLAYVIAETGTDNAHKGRASSSRSLWNSSNGPLSPIARESSENVTQEVVRQDDEFEGRIILMTH